MVADLLSVLLHDHSPHVHDRGPHYFEFHHDAVLREPWNAWSSVFFLVPVIYWTWRLRGKYHEHQLIVMLLPFLFLNGIGSTLFHAFRASNFFLYLDFAPAAIMSLVLTYMFWKMLVGKWWVSVGIIILSFLPRILVFVYREELNLDRQDAVNISYFFTGMMFILPTLLITWRTNWYRWHLIFLSIVFLSFALLFRNLDERAEPLLPMGTHWLWHVVSALSVFTLGYYLYYLQRKEVRPIL